MFIAPIFALSVVLAPPAPSVRVLGEMKRMFMAHDIGANVDLAKVNQNPHVYALGPLGGLQGEITVSDGTVYVSRASGDQARVETDPSAKAVFLVYASVQNWRTLDIPPDVTNEKDLASFVGRQMPPDSRSAFLVEGTAVAAEYHIQKYDGRAADLTHAVHEKSKRLFKIANTPIQLVGFFSNRENDAGSFVHMDQTTHIHLITGDHKQMGHLESIKLGPGAKLLLPMD